MSGGLRPRIAISLGDPCGIGTEALVRSLCDSFMRDHLEPWVFGDAGVWARAIELVGQDPGLDLVADPAGAWPPSAMSWGRLIPVSALEAVQCAWGSESEASCHAQLRYLEAATAAAVEGKVQALMTAPITKAAIAKAGFPYPGQTEFLKARSGAQGVTMMLAGPRLKVAVVTTHLALSKVPAAITAPAVEATVQRTARALQEDFGIPEPRIALCGLNPHAGERGRFGDEEVQLLAPLVARLSASLQAQGVCLLGPVAADAALAKAVRGDYDAVIALYHDQGLAAAKAVDQDESVNLSLGLPFPRTSPDHGSALDIAGQGVARPASTVAALKLAARLARS